MNPYVVIAIMACIIIVLLTIAYLQFFKRTDDDLREEIDLLEMENKHSEMKIVEIKEWKIKADKKIRKNNSHNHNTIEELINDKDAPAWMNE